LSILYFFINPSTAHLYGTTGVRPSPGAAGSESPSTLESTKTPLLPDVAAPGDGRTPGQAGFDAGGARKMRPFLQDGVAVSLANQVQETSDYATVQKVFNIEKRMALVRSLVNLNKGATGDLDRCSVLVSIAESDFILWTPLQDGQDVILRPFAKAEWAAKKCSAKIFS
jgi:hypothetical protein